jgi:hypothetical protein
MGLHFGPVAHVTKYQRLGWLLGSDFIQLAGSLTTQLSHGRRSKKKHANGRVDIG